MKNFMKRILLLLALVMMSISFIACPDSTATNTTVYVTATGNVYHKTSSAHGYKTQSMSLENAKNEGYTACKNGCY